LTASMSLSVLLGYRYNPALSAFIAAVGVPMLHKGCSWCFVKAQSPFGCFTITGIVAASVHTA